MLSMQICFPFVLCTSVVQIMLEYICLFFNSDNNLYQVLGELRFWIISMIPRIKPSSLVGEASDLMMQMNLMRNESLNLIVAYSAYEVCMRGIRGTSLIEQFFRVETQILFSSANLDLENIF